MQQRIVTNCARRPVRPSGRGLFVPLAVSLGVVIAGVCPLRGRAMDDTGARSDGQLPTVLLVMEKPTGMSPQQDDLITRLKTTLKEALLHSGRFQVHTFLPNESVIKRALNEHLIASDDLVEPHKPDGLQRIARAIGSRFILKVRTALERTDVRTDMSYMENPNLSDWLVIADDHVSVPLVIGRKRLKFDDIVNLTVDSITSRIGVPTHLAGKLQQMPGTRVFDDLDLSGKKTKSARTQKEAPKTIAKESGDPSNPGATRIDPPVPTETPIPSAATKRQTTKSGQNLRAARGKPADGAKLNTDSNHGDVQPRPIFTNEADPAHGTLPAQPTVAPAPVISRPDYEAQAARYRQTGDLSNAVVALRRAVNERPHEVGLRRQLIQAYQARQMPEAAHAEALRAMRLDSANASLYRLYGEVLLAQGDLPGAMQAFREGIKIDPADIACQVALGDALLADNHHMLAIDAYDAAAKSDPKSPMPHRRIARALAARAGTDLVQYPASLAELRRANELTPPTDTTSYRDDYIAIMRIVEGRIRDMLDELQAANQARVQSKQSSSELVRQIADMKQRGGALTEYLDKLPPAPGQDVTQAHFAQANSLLLQTIGFFKDVVEKGDDRFSDSMKSGQVQAQRELTTASQRLSGTKASDKTNEKA